MLANADSTAVLTAFFQAGATLVAIIAGIIGARFVAAHGGVQGLRIRCDHLRSDEQSLTSKLRSAQATVRRKRAVRRANGGTFLDDFVLTTDPAVVVAKEGAIDPRIRDYFRSSIERIEDYLPRCEELVAHWDDRPLSIGTLTLDNAPNSGTFNGSVFAHYVLERARQRRSVSPEHELKCGNLETEVRRRDKVRHQVLAREIEDAVAREEWLADELEAAQRRAGESRKELDLLEAGEGYRLSLRVLGFVSMLVMFPSAALLLYHPDAWGSWPNVGVVALFATGLLVMLRYLYVYSAFIKGEGPLPSSAFKLLLPLRWWRQS